MEAKLVLDHVLKYLEKNMVPTMNDGQEFLFYTALEGVEEESDFLISRLTANPVTRALAAIDKDGNVDIDKLVGRLNKAFERKGKLQINIPLFGPVKFLPEDLNAIADSIRGESRENNSPVDRPY